VEILPNWFIYRKEEISLVKAVANKKGFHPGETNHLQYFDSGLKQLSPPCGPCDLCELFPNVCIILRIFLTIPAEVASAERFFSKLKLEKKFAVFYVTNSTC